MGLQSNGSLLHPATTVHVHTDGGVVLLTAENTDNVIKSKRNSIKVLIGRLKRVTPAKLQKAIAVFVVLVLSSWLGFSSLKTATRWYRCRPRPVDDALGYADPIYPRSMAYIRSQELTRKPDLCAEAADFPQVALLFLTKGNMHHETMWKEWFSYAANRIPSAVACPIPDNVATNLNAAAFAGVLHTSAQSAGSNFGAFEKFIPKGKMDASDYSAVRNRIMSACTETGSDVIASQHLFDVWVHPSLEFPGFPGDSIFHGRELPPDFRVRTVWGTHTLIDATRALIAAALTNPRAAKFVLLSESDIPLYSPLTVYAQLMSEPRSRINACNKTDDWDHNFGWRLREDMIAEGLNYDVWRKSWQWVALNRDHAELAVKDKVVDNIFRATCRRRWDADWCDHRVCYSDEHYLPTLLASHGKSDETDCSGELTHRDWSRVKETDPHPWEYTAEETTAELVRSLRHEERPGCGHAETLGPWSLHQFLDTSQLSRENKAEELKLSGFLGQCTRASVAGGRWRPLGPKCPLFARKFKNNTVKSVLAALLPCRNGLGILNEGQTVGSTAQIILQDGNAAASVISSEIGNSAEECGSSILAQRQLQLLQQLSGTDQSHEPLQLQKLSRYEQLGRSRKGPQRGEGGVLLDASSSTQHMYDHENGLEIHFWGSLHFVFTLLVIILCLGVIMILRGIGIRFCHPSVTSPRQKWSVRGAGWLLHWWRGGGRGPLTHNDSFHTTLRRHGILN